MAANTFGKIFQLTSFGESHGSAIGGVIDGCPAGLKVDLVSIQDWLDERSPGKNNYATERNENDQVTFISGLLEGVTTGHPIAFLVHNKDQKSSDYSDLKNAFRPGHADKTYFEKYGLRDENGGGRSSARTTIALVVAGALAYQLLQKVSSIEIVSYISQIEKIAIDESKVSMKNFIFQDKNFLCPDMDSMQLMKEKLNELKEKGDTTGGIISCRVTNMLPSLGEPLYHKLSAALAHAMLSINAAKGFEYGDGFASASSLGSMHNDTTDTNHAGGMEGGISNGKDLFFRVAFKPISSIKTPQLMETKDGNIEIKSIVGRHDPCPVIRAVPIVRALTALVLADMYLLNRISKL